MKNNMIILAKVRSSDVEYRSIYCKNSLCIKPAVYVIKDSLSSGPKLSISDLQPIFFIL